MGYKNTKQSDRIITKGEYTMTIAEVSKMYDLIPDTLRYYERIGLLSSVSRNAIEIQQTYSKNTITCRYKIIIHIEEQ